MKSIRKEIRNDDMNTFKIKFMLAAAILTAVGAISGRADDTHKVLNSTKDTYEDVRALHLVTNDEFTKHGVNSIPFWAGKDSKTLAFPITFNQNAQIQHYGQFEWIVPEAFSTTKTGSLLEFNAKYIDGTDDSHPNIVSNMCFITNNIGSGTHYPDYNTNDVKNQLFNGSFDVKYYPNANTISNGTMTLGAGKFRVRLTSDVLKKLQNSGITLAGRGVTYEQVNIVDPYAVFPGANSTTTLTVGGPNNSSNTDANWWQNAIVLDKSLFTNAKAGFQIRVFTTPTSDNANVYTGYPTNEGMSKTELNQTDDETSQVYFQVITGTTASPTKKLIDKGWDYMNTDAVFTIDQETLDTIKNNSDCTVQLIVRDATIRKVSLAKVWSERQNIEISGESKKFETGNTWSDNASTTETEADRKTYIGVYTRNILGLGNVMVGDTIRIPVSSVQSGAEYQFQLFGDNTSTVADDRLCNLSQKITLSTDKQVIEYALTEDDVKKINTWVTKSDGTKDPKWYWIALRGKGFTANNIYYDKNTSSVQNHDVYLDESQEITTIGDEPNVNVHLKRKFTKGKWATIMFPFSLNAQQINDAFGPNCVVARFNRSDINDDPNETGYTPKYKRIFLTSASVINANEPQMLKIVDDNYAKDEYEFDNVDLTMRSSKDLSNVNYGNGYLTCGQFTMIGTYSKIPELPKYAVILLNRKNDHHNNDMHQDFYWVGDNTIKNGGKSIKGYHWYMYLGSGGQIQTSDYTNYFASSSSSKVSFYLDDEPMFDNDDPTLIHDIDYTSEARAKAIYNLQGQLVRDNGDTTDLAPGLYIVNGKKIMVN